MDDRNYMPQSHADLCQAEHCSEKARSAGWCTRHYQQIRRHGRLTPESEHHPKGELCEAPDCDRQQIAKGYCFRHYQQVRRYGHLTPEREREYGRTACKVPGCQSAHAARGYCRRHYLSEYYIPLSLMCEQAERQGA